MTEEKEHDHFHPSMMDLDLVDYTSAPDWLWHGRRLLIGSILSFYGFYLLMFISEMVTPGSTLLAEDFTEEVQAAVSEGIPYGSKLFMMVSLGVAGSILLLLRTFVRTRRNHDLPVSWYLLQPLQGGLMSLFLYFIFRAGGMVFYESTGGEEGMNIYVLGSLAIVTGIFSERAFHSLVNASKKLLKVKDDSEGGSEGSEDAGEGIEEGSEPPKD